MSELRYPNESRAYREARDLLLKEEQELVDKVRAVAEKRRSLPVGVELKEDDVFEWAGDGKVGTTPPQDFRSGFLEKNDLDNT
ncbi:hypothetical protein WT81_27120 [Burkholderia stagnalis]|uniref:DUF899 family protein n=1 Tax=Burkholderia stagnalis TaxID=1503054 RepID=UPI00075FE045|nr:hypothetical protein WT80_13290 [Burkholderia stagnalis]KWK52240.1 hypothetical protein WT81_27120 [Burkholderia stagnalis]KWN66563.1 hypothetical protein WT90_29410 [Burkholderia stagnalis]